MAEKIPQLTEEQKLIVEKLKAQQDKVRSNYTRPPRTRTTDVSQFF